MAYAVMIDHGSYFQVGKIGPSSTDFPARRTCHSLSTQRHTITPSMQALIFQTKHLPLWLPVLKETLPAAQERDNGERVGASTGCFVSERWSV